VTPDGELTIVAGKVKRGEVDSPGNALIKLSKVAAYWERVASLLNQYEAGAPVEES
jgi:hypothetical protein